MYFEVELLGIPAGFARFEELGLRPCREPDTVREDCELYRYLVNLSKLRSVLGKIIIVSDVYIRRRDHEVVSNTIVIKTDQSRQDIRIERDEVAAVMNMYDGPQLVAQFTLEPKIQTLASLPITIRREKTIGPGKLPLISGKQLVTVDFFTEEMDGKFTVKQGDKEYLIFYGPLWEAEKIVVLPVMLMGTPIGDITAVRLKK